MYIRPYKKESTRSQSVSHDFCDCYPNKRIKGDYSISFSEYHENQDLYVSVFGGRDPYNRYVNDCEEEDGWETLSASSLSPDPSTLSWGTAVFSKLQDINSPPVRKSINLGHFVLDIPLLIETSDTTSVTSELSIAGNKTVLVPSIVPYNRIGTTYDIREHTPEVLGFLPDPAIPTPEPEFPWDFARPTSPYSEEDVRLYSEEDTCSESYDSELLVLPQNNNYELRDDQKYTYLAIDPEFWYLSRKEKGISPNT